MEWFVSKHVICMPMNVICRVEKINELYEEFLQDQEQRNGEKSVPKKVL